MDQGISVSIPNLNLLNNIHAGVFTPTVYQFLKSFSYFTGADRITISAVTGSILKGVPVINASSAV